jgi:hypothetical protein
MIGPARGLFVLSACIVAFFGAAVQHIFEQLPSRQYGRK